jgi:hypothetical protein
MNAGMTREEVVDGFTHSEEFVNICNAFGFIPYEGYVSTEEDEEPTPPVVEEEE